LALTGFFNTMYHIDGYVIKLKHNQIFDYGRRAVKSPLHPETGYPLESYRMVFVDDGMFDGEPNLQMVAEKGRRFLHGVVPGLTPMPSQYRILAGVGNIGQGDLSILASDVDASSYHRFASCGVQLRRGNTSLHLECVARLEYSLVHSLVASEGRELYPLFFLLPQSCIKPYLQYQII